MLTSTLEDENAVSLAVPCSPAPAPRPHVVPATSAAPASARVLDITRSATRLPLIDEVRGLYLTWMICAHSMTLAHLPPSHPLQYLRPAGWATTGFLMLTGLTLAVSYASRGVSALAERRLRRRSLQVAAVAIVSNVTFLLIRSIVDGSWSMDASLRILALRTSWSISAILLPTAAVLALAPWLVRVTRRIGATTLFTLALALTVGLDVVVMSAHTPAVQQVLVLGAPRPDYFNFPLAFLLRLAIWGFGVGAFLGSQPKTKALLLASAAGMAVLATRHWIGWTPSMVAESRLLLVLGAVRLAALVPQMAAARGLLTRIGRAALPIFLAHRVVVQAGARILDGHLASGALAAVLIAGALFTCLVLAYVREHRLQIRAVLTDLGI